MTRFSFDGVAAELTKGLAAGFEKMADEVAENLATKAAEEFKTEVKRKLVAHLGAVLYRNFSMGMDANDLVIKVNLGDEKK